MQGCELAARKLILSIAIAAAAAAPAAALTSAEWDIKFVRGLSQRNYVDLAEELAEQIKKAGAQPADIANIYIFLAEGIIDGVEASPDLPMETQLKLVEKAEATLKSAIAASPEIAKTISYRAQVASLKQRQAAALAARIPQLPEADREKVFKQVDALFTEVEKQFEQTIQDARKEMDKLSGAMGKTTAEQEKIEKDTDAALLQIAVYELRQSMAYYAHYELYDNKPADPKRKELAKKALERLDQVAYEAEDTSLVAYAHYYTGMIQKKEKVYDKAVEAFDKIFVLPKEIQVPEILRRTYFDYSDTLVKAEKFQEAIKKLDSFLLNKQISSGEDNEVRGKLYKATALFAWALKLKSQTGAAPQQPLPEGIKKHYDAAMELCRGVIGKSEKWAPTANGIVSEWSRKVFPDSEDATVLMADASARYEAKAYLEAASLFQKVLANVRAQKSTRLKAGYYCAMSYYKAEDYYRGYVSADWLATRFSPEKYDYARKAVIVAILSLKKQFEKTNDDFDKGLYIATRKQLGEEEFLLVEVNELESQGKLEEAIKACEKVTPKASVYDAARYKIAHLNDQMADRLLREKKYAQGIDMRTKAVKLYKAFLDWCVANPPKEERVAVRHDLECRAIHKVGRLVLENAVESYYAGQIKRSQSNKVELANAIKGAAPAMLQAVPDKMPANAQDATALLAELREDGIRTFLKLSEDVRTRFPEATIAQPYVIYLRVLALLRVADLPGAEKELESLKEFTDFAATAEAYGRVAMAFDTQARSLEKQEKKADAEKVYTRAIDYFQQMITIDPKQNFDMLYYIIMLAYNHGQNMSIDDRMKLVNGFLDEYGDKTEHETEVDNVKLVAAGYYVIQTKYADALPMYEELVRKYDAAYEKAQEKDPRAGRSARDWDARRGLAKVHKALGKWAEARNDFSAVSLGVPVAGDTWWDATASATECMVELKDYARVISTVKTTFLLHPDMGGPEMRGRFQMVLGKIAAVDFKNEKVDYAKQATDLLQQMMNQNKESQ